MLSQSNKPELDSQSREIEDVNGAKNKAILDEINYPSVQKSSTPSNDENSDDDILLAMIEDEMNEDRKKSRRTYVAAVAFLLAVMSAVSGWMWYKHQKMTKPSIVETQPVVPSASTDTNPSASQSVTSGTSNNPSTSVTNATPSNAPVTSAEPTIAPRSSVVPSTDEDLLVDVPNDSTIVMEELDKLSDEQQRLQEAARNLQKQSETSAEIIRLKEKQLAELKAQLAELDE